MSNVHCDKCKKYFDIKPQEKKHGNGIVETFFVCPHCKARYTAFVTNAETRRKQREIKKLRDSLPGITDFDEYQTALGVIHAKQDELAPLMAKLKAEVTK